MNVEIIQDNDVAGAQAGDELGADVSLEGVAIHGTAEHPGRDDPVNAQARDEGLGAPFAEGR